MTKILMTTDTLGGIWTYSVELADALSDYGINTVLVTMGAPLNSSQLRDIKHLKNIEVFKSDFKLEWMNNPWLDVERAGDWLLYLEEKVQPDIIHLNGFCHGVLEWKQPVIVAGHSCMLSWWQTVKKEDTPEWLGIYYKKAKAGLHAADMVIAPSYTMMNELNKFYGNFNRQRVIYNGRNESLFSIKPKEKFVISTGRIWDEGNNIKAVIEAAPKFKYPLFLAGTNEDSPINKSMELNNVNFLGSLSLLSFAFYLSRASVFVHPAKYEPFGLGPLEAALSGCALVLGDIPSLREIWGNSALYVSTDDTDDIAEKVNMLTSNKDMLKKYSQRAYTQAKKYSSKTMGGKYSALYSSLITAGEVKVNL